jgi:hypothetical protein
MGFTLQISLLWLAAFLLALMPLQDHDAIFFLAAFLVLAASFVQALLQYGTVPRGNALVLCGLGFWTLALTSVIFSQVPYVSFIYFCLFSAMPLSFLLPPALQQKEAFFRYTGYGLGALFTALGVFSIVEYFTLPDWLNHGSLHWPLTDPNSFAEMYALAFFCSFGLMLAGRTRLHSDAGLFLSLLFMACVFMSGSKGVLFCLLAALAIFAAAAWPHVRKHWRCCAWPAGGSVAIFAALTALGASPQKAFWLKYSTEYGLYPRNTLIQGAWEIGWAHAWTGTGIGTFFLYYPEHRRGDTHSAGFMAHNDPLQFFSEMGIFAPILFYGFIAMAGLRTLNALKFAPPASAERIHIMVPFCALGTLAVHAHMNFDLNVMALLMLSGLLMSYWHARTQEAPAFIVLSKNARGIAAFAVFMGAFSFAALQGSEILTNRAQQRIGDGDLEGFMHDVNTADQLAMGRNARALTLAASVPIVVLETNKEIGGEERKAHAKRAEGFLTRAEALNPRLPAVPYYRARLYATAGGKDPAVPEQLLRQALHIDPMHMASRQMLAEILARKGH